MLQYMFLCIINTLFGLYVSMYIHINLCAKHSFTDFFFFFFYSFGVEFNDHISCLSLSVRVTPPKDQSFPLDACGKCVNAKGEDIRSVLQPSDNIFFNIFFLFSPLF